MDDLPNNKLIIIDSLYVSCGIVSLSCSIMTLWLIYSLQKRNGYVLLIASMCVSEMIYDLGFILSFYHNMLPCKLKLSFLFVGGIAVSIWTNVIACIVFYMVTYLSRVNIYKYYPYFFFVAFVVPCVVGYSQFPEAFNWHCQADMNPQSYWLGNIYAYWRVISVFISIIAYALTSYKVRQMKHNKNEATDLISSLSKRMKYYVLVQILIRLIPTYVEIIAPNSSFILFVLAAISAPLSGLGYFIVFLTMHPRAGALFLTYFRCLELRTNRLIRVRDTNGERDTNSNYESIWFVHCELIPMCMLDWLCCVCTQIKPFRTENDEVTESLISPSMTNAANSNVQPISTMTMSTVQSEYDSEFIQDLRRNTIYTTVSNVDDLYDDDAILNDDAEETGEDNILTHNTMIGSVDAQSNL